MPTSRPHRYAERQAANEESRNGAEHHAEPWSQEETEFLQSFWDGTEDTLREISETLGRTIEACRQRHYYVEHHVTTPRPTTPSHTSGWLVGLCMSCNKITDVFCTGVTQECEDCK